MAEQSHVKSSYISSIMADTYRYCIPMLPLLIACLCLSKENVTSRLVEIRQRTRDNSRVNFLAVGDWGRKGGYNQSAVARRVKT